MSLNKISGDDAWMDPPVPIPNTVVKHPEAESTCLVTGWEDRKLPVRSSGDGYVVPPVPIPNTVVKHIYAESTCLVTGWEDRKPLVKEVMQCFAWLFCCCRYDPVHGSMLLPAAGIACGLENMHTFSCLLPDNSQSPVGNMRRIAFCSEIC